MCNDALYLTVYETATIHSQGTQNPEVHDMIMHASHVIGRGQGHSRCMAHKKDIFFLKNPLSESESLYYISTVNMQDFVFCGYCGADNFIQ